MNLVRLATATAALAALAAVRGAAQQAAPAPGLMAYNPANKHYYQAVAVPGGLTWMEAHQAAGKRTYMGVRGHLLTITSEAEQKFITSSFWPLEYLIGAYQDHRVPDYKEPAGGWRWVTGEPWGYTCWYEGEPNNGDKGEDIAILWTSSS
jgi:hypothetical protein